MTIVNPNKGTSSVLEPLHTARKTENAKTELLYSESKKRLMAQFVPGKRFSLNASFSFDRSLIDTSVFDILTAMCNDE